MSSIKDHKIALCGIQEQGKDIAQFLIKNDIPISYIITIPRDLAIKNKSESTWVSHEEFAAKYKIPIYYCKSYSLTEKEDIDFFSKERFDLLLLGGWQRLIGKSILQTLKYGAIGQHGSSEFLPKGRGRSPINWCIIEGRKRLIWHLFLLDTGTDDGDVIDFEIFDITESDTVKTIYYKVSTVVKYMLLRTIPKIFNNNISVIKQLGTPTYYAKRTEGDGKIDWNVSVYGIYNFVRAITRPYPGAFAIHKKRKIKIWETKIWDTQLSKFYIDNDYGEIVEIFGNEFVVKCYDGLLLITNHEDNNLYIGKKYD